MGREHAKFVSCVSDGLRMYQESVIPVTRAPLPPFEYEAIFPTVIIEPMEPVGGSVIAAHPSFKSVTHFVPLFFFKVLVIRLRVNFRVRVRAQEYDAAGS